MLIFRLYFMLICAAIIGFFAANNTHITTIDLILLPFVIQLPTYLVILMSIMVGFVFGSLKTLTYKFGLWRTMQQQTNTIDALKNELSGIKLKRITKSRDKTYG